MTNPLIIQGLQDTHELPVPKPVDEAVWQAWALRGRAREKRNYAVRMTAVKWISLAGVLLAGAAGLWSRVMPYDLVVRFLVAAGAATLMSQALHTRNYTFATVFGALALLYNPVAPVFNFSGEWQRALIVASAVPFVASLAWRDTKLATNE